MGKKPADILILAGGVFAGSTSIVFIKLSSTPPLYLASFRMLIAAFFLLPLYIRLCRRKSVKFTFAIIKKAFPPALFLGLHFITWIYGSRLTMAANAALMVDLQPIAMPFVVYLLCREKLTGKEAAATILAVGGVLLLGAGSYKTGTGIWGNILCFVSMIFITFYLALAKRGNSYPVIWLYVVPVYLTGGIIVFAAALAVQGFSAAVTPAEILYILGLALVPTVIGHSALNYSMGRFPAQVVSIMNLGEFVYAALFGLAVFGEYPAPLFYPSAVLVIAGAFLALTSRPVRKNASGR